MSEQYELNKQPFSEKSLPLPYDSQFRAKVTFDTTIIENQIGREQRFPNRTEYRLKCDLSDLILREQDAKNILDFFKARNGSNAEFRFKFWADCTATHQPWIHDTSTNASGDTIEIKTQGIVLQDNNNSSKGQLVKIYEIHEIHNTTQNTKHTAYKTITKPIINDNFKVFSGGTEKTSGFDLNTALGTITTTDGTNAGSLTWQGEFELPVRFDRDSFPQVLLVETGKTKESYAEDFRNLQSNLYRFDSLPIIEEPKQSSLDITLTENYSKINTKLDFGYQPGSTLDSNFDNYSYETFNKRTFRESREDNKPTLEFDRVILDQGRLIYSSNKAESLFVFFVVAKGRLLNFSYSEVSETFQDVRFNTDELEIEPLARLGSYESDLVDVGYFKFGYNNLSLKTFPLPDFDFDIDNETYLLLYYDTSGSMYEFSSAVSEGFELAKEVLKDSVYGGDQSLVNKYLKRVNSNSERWLDWAGTDARDSTSEPKKQATVLFINESEDRYHDDDDGSKGITEPTTEYETDYNDFTNFISDAEIIKSQVIAIQGGSIQYLSGGDTFLEHLKNAIEGNAPYDTLGTGLKDLGGSVPTYGFFSSKSPEDNLQDPILYRNLILNTLNSSNFSDIELGITSSTNNLNNLITEEINPIARCVLITRKDGVKLGFTSHDKDLIIDGVTYRAREAQTPTNIERKNDLSINNSELESVISTLSSPVINDADLVAGKYKDAEVKIFLVDFTNLPSTPSDGFLLQDGLIGEINTDNLTYSFEIMSKTDTLLNREAVDKISPTCQYNLGDSNCGVDLTNKKQTVTIDYQSDDYLALNFNETLNVSTSDTNNYSFGTVEFTTGLNAGLKEYIFQQLDSNSVELFKPMPYQVQSGDELVITQGCAKNPEACKAYSNFNNFGGFPTDGNFMPGNDFIYNALD